MSVITLTTDFGLADEFVGVMKGVILSRCPQASIIDLCHAIPPQGILQAAHLIEENFHFFPKGTIHVVVVDPGVGSNRDIIILTYLGHYFLAPDNGVLSPLFLKNRIDSISIVTRSDLYLSPTSSTFHGRDIFAPIAAALASGASPADLGPATTAEKLQAIEPPSPCVNQTNLTIQGSVIKIDHFGNIITNINQETAGAMITSPEHTRVSFGRELVYGLHTNYSSVTPGSPLLLFNSNNLLEIAINCGNAANNLHAKLYDQVTLTCK